MRILLDECLPERLAGDLGGHAVVTVPQAGWAGISNGQLLRLAAGRFDVFVTVDRNLAFQQNISKLPIPVIVLKAKRNRYQDLVPLVGALVAALSRITAAPIQFVGD